MLLAGCGNNAHYPVNAPLGQQHAKDRYHLQRVAHDPTNPGDVLVVLSFSGGGMRAAALAYGTLEALRDTSVPIGGTRRTLLDEVDIINAVSGGSIVAAYYALYRDGIFRDFKEHFLRRDVERDLQLRVATNAARLASSHFGRTDLLAEYFDDRLFQGKTFGDLARGADRPFVWPVQWRHRRRCRLTSRRSRCITTPVAAARLRLQGSPWRRADRRTRMASTRASARSIPTGMSRDVPTFTSSTAGSSTISGCGRPSTSSWRAAASWN
jgi:hypothetical protein